MSDNAKRKCYTFVPRSLTHKQPKQKLPKTSCISKVDKPTSSSLNQEEVEEEEAVKQLSSQQRWPSADEPFCIVCKRYGEYICDATDEDVCSIECKTIHLNSHHSHGNQNLSTPTEFTEQHTQCIEKEDFDSLYSSKVVYKPSTEIASASEYKNMTIKQKLEINTKGTYVPKLILNFNQCSFAKQLLVNLQENGFVAPTPVQMQTIPIILSRSDVLVSACTSSGKTASFILPIIQNIFNCFGSLSPSHEFCKYPLALIAAPTRELAIQIEEVTKFLSKSMSNIRTALLIGGVPLAPQLHRLKHKIQVLIGTPGRINDILDNYELLQLKNIKMVVLDEVDVMLQMGFQNQIQTIIEAIPSKPQFMMFSATIPPSIEKLASKMMHNPVYVSVGLSGKPDKSIKQIILWVEDVSKKKKLFSIIEDSKHFLPPAIVFVDSKIGADMLCEAITHKFELNCESIHSNKSQSERTRILQDFLSGAYEILVSTNVMGRGIDLFNVREVILFDMPHSIEEYTHQIGRAGGRNASGFVISFINNSNKKIFYDLKSLLESDNIKLPDQLIHSPHLKIDTDKKDKSKTLQKSSSLSRRNDDINPQNLLQILTKNRKNFR